MSADAPAAGSNAGEARAPAVAVHNLAVRYGSNVALDELSLELAAGGVHGVIGMNGSGKSTFFKTLVGLVRPDHGEVRIAGGSNEAARRAGLIAYAPQNEEIDWSFPISVRDVVMTGRYGHMGLARRATAADVAAVDHALARAELTELADRQIGQLSGGQRKRAFVARGLAQEAEIMLLDEPFAGVDKRSEATITQLLRELSAEGRTVVISTHDLVTLPALCDHVALLNHRVIAYGAPGEVLVPRLLAQAFGGFIPADAIATGDLPQALDEGPR